MTTPDNEIEKAMEEFRERFGDNEVWLTELAAEIHQGDANIRGLELWLRAALTAQREAGKTLGITVTNELLDDAANNGRAQALKEAVEEKKELLEALAMMYEQYCDGGHDFMSAGERACLVLERFKVLNPDDAGRGDIKWAIIEAFQSLTDKT